jgi:phage gpG-like protein
MKSKFIDFRVDPKGSFKKALRQAGKISSDLRAPFKTITMSFYKSNKFLFKDNRKLNVFDDLSENPLYAFWLKDNDKAVIENQGSKFFEGGYKDLKQKKYGFVYPILKATGALERSITDPTDPNAISSVLNKTTLLLGTKLPYAGWLQNGTKKMPARPFLVVGTEKGLWAQSTQMQRRKEAWMRTLEKYCADSIRKGKK